MRALVAAWLTLLWLLVGCSAEIERVPATEVLVRISADPEVLESTATLRVRAAREGPDGQWQAASDRSFARADLRWPVDIVITPGAENDAKVRFEVIVESMSADDQVLAQARAITGFILRETRVLNVLLAPCGDRPLGFVCEAEESCLGPTCQACTSGGCGPVPQVEPDDLIGIELDAATGNRDAGDEDGGTGSERIDAEVPSMEAGSSGGEACPAGSRANTAAGCVDIDECAEELDDCSEAPDACVNLERAGFQCSCPAGYEGDGKGARGCTDVNECMAEPPVCGTSVRCTNQPPGSYQCGDCPAGYTVDGADNCQDIDECLSDNGGCDTNPMAQCMNQTGAPNSCACLPGYTGNGRGSNGCTNIDDCSPNPCVHGEACTDRVQDYVCACGTGYSGKNCQNDVCSPNPCPTNYKCTRGDSGAVCRPMCATSAGRCTAGQPCEATADCASGLTCDSSDKTCLQTCAGPVTVTSRESLDDIRYCREVQGDLILDTLFPTLAATDLPHLRRVTGSLRDSFMSSLRSLELPAVATVGNLAFSGVTIVILPSLTRAASVELVFTQTRIEMQALTQVTGHVNFGLAPDLSRIDLRSLTTVGTNLTLNDLPNLTSLNINMLDRVGGSFTAAYLIRLPYSSVRRLHDSATGLDRVSGVISIENVGCCLLASPQNQYGCPGSPSGC